MENTALRTRYARSNAYYRKRKTYARTKEKVRIKEVIAKQTVISIFIFILLFTIENVDTSVTNYLSDNIRLILQQDINMNAVIDKANYLIYGLLNRTNTDFILNSTNNISANQNDTSNSVNSGDINSSDASDSFNDAGSSDNENNQENPPAQPTLNLIAPVKGEISSPFGPRIDPITQISKFHYGLDIDTEKGTLIKAAADGEVLEIAEDKIYGKNIKIKHPDGTITVYAHCSKIYQVEGNKVSQGDIIAEVGDTGYSTGTHLHFEIWRNGEALDPALYVDVEQ